MVVNIEYDAEESSRNKKKILKDRTLIKQAENVEFVTNKHIQQ